MSAQGCREGAGSLAVTVVSGSVKLVEEDGRGQIPPS